MDETRRLAAFVRELDPDGLDPAVGAAVARSLVDPLAVACAGVETAAGEAVLEAALDVEALGSAGDLSERLVPRPVA